MEDLTDRATFEAQIHEEFEAIDRALVEMLTTINRGASLIPA